MILVARTTKYVDGIQSMSRYVLIGCLLKSVCQIMCCERIQMDQKYGFSKFSVTARPGMGRVDGTHMMPSIHGQ